MKIISIEATDIPDAWFQLLYQIINYGRRSTIERGSNVEQERIQFDHITVHIKYPYAEPYDNMLPHVPVGLGIPNPVEPGYVEQYVPYLMTGHTEPNEAYTYGSRIEEQIPYWIEVLKKTPNTNQAVLQVARPEDFKLSDPPCLRHITIQVKEEEGLIFYPDFRSWDLQGGFPANLAGIAVLQKYMADEIGLPSGPIVATSSGLHIYGYSENITRIRTYKNI